MTLILKTESHGEVESGFYAAFMQFARLGEYTFATRHLCEAIQYLAENNKTLETKLLGYDPDKFWTGSTAYHQKIARLILEQAGQSTLPASKEAGLKKQLEQWQTEIHIKDGEDDVYSPGRIIPVTVIKEEQSILIGDYQISSVHFGRMSRYLANGGLFGWGNPPQFAEITMKAIQNSSRELYRSIREEIKASQKRSN